MEYTEEEKKIIMENIKAMEARVMEKIEAKMKQLAGKDLKDLE